MVNKKVALVTGASSGIGRSTALAFAKAGAIVVCSARRISESEETVKMIQEMGGEAVFIQADVSKDADVKNLIDRIVKQYGRLDWAFNNAGYGGPLVPFADHTEADWDQIIDINLKGVWLCMKYEIQQMLKQGAGSIVNTASVAGLVGTNWGIAPYIASKHGVVGLTKAGALEYASNKIRVNAVCPAVIATPMIDALGDPTPLNALHPMGRIGDPEEVADVVLWLCSDQSSFVTGQAVAVDGGFTTW